MSLSANTKRVNGELYKTTRDKTDVSAGNPPWAPGPFTQNDFEVMWILKRAYTYRNISTGLCCRAFSLPSPSSETNGMFDTGKETLHLCMGALWYAIIAWLSATHTDYLGLGLGWKRLIHGFFSILLSWNCWSTQGALLQGKQSLLISGHNARKQPKLWV